MPFEVMRRHQKKLLVIFGLMAMVSFVLADSLQRFLYSNSSSGNTGDPTVATLYGRTIHRSDLREISSERRFANLFMSFVGGGQRFFGGVSTRELVDGLILQHEADALGIPGGADAAREWLKASLGPTMTAELFQAIMARMPEHRRLSGEQVLAMVGNQFRLLSARRLAGSPVVTPLDVFRDYRDQNERVSAYAFAFPAADYLKEVPEPSTTQVQAYFDQYKDVLPDESRDTPGFKVPRLVRVEILSADPIALGLKLKESIKEDELKIYYENHKSEYKRPTEYPDDLFVNDSKAELTPPQFQTFDEVKPFLASSLAADKAQNEITDAFNAIRDEVLEPFVDRYLEVVDEIDQSKRQGRTLKIEVPKWQPVKEAAAKHKLDYELTPPLSHAEAEHYGQIHDAEVGQARLSGGRKFVDEFFDPKSSFFVPIELTDFAGRRYLARKVEDDAPRIPSLDEIRGEVVRAWKLEQARPFAEKAAKAFAESLAKKLASAGPKTESPFKNEKVDGKPFVATDPVTKLTPGLPIPGQLFMSGPPTPSEIRQIPFAGETLRDVLFQLAPKQVEVASDQPKTTYYVLALNRRIPAPLSALYAPNGDYFRYQAETMSDAREHQYEAWMKELRVRAGLDPNWTPRDETDRESEA